MVKESFLIAGGEKVDALSRYEDVSMGDPEAYSQQAGVLTFRGGPLRQNGADGTVTVEEEQLTVLRGVRTGTLANTYKGFGYGSQPVIVKWYKNIREMMNMTEESKKTTAMKEVIFASDDGNIYFFDLDKKVYSRQPISVGFPMSTTVSVNPYGYPLLYVGQTEDSVDGYTGMIGMRIYNLIDQQLLSLVTGIEEKSKSTKEGAIPTSAIVEAGSDTIIYGGENGLLYTLSMNTDFDLDEATITVSPQSAAYGYVSKLKNAKQGITTSVATYGDYAYFGDRAGSVQCVDMNTLQCVWAVDMEDSVMGSVSLEVDGDNVYLYAGNVVNKRARSSEIKLVKIDALSGEIIWQHGGKITGKYASKTAKENIFAGAMASPVIGQGEISDLVIFSLNHVSVDKDAYAVVYALDKETGEEVWSQPLDVDSLSSPIAMYQPDGKSYLVMGDENGTLRLMDGFSGMTISTVNLGSAIRSAPDAYGNEIVVGTTGGMIYFVELK